MSTAVSPKPCVESTIAAAIAPPLLDDASLSIYALRAEVAVRITRSAHMRPRHFRSAARRPRYV
ncbi:hypothetical protein CO709_15960 [Burkholderia thailandensis]|nr:hypothetical protein CO709_15960 [Burkholderia thailandensis]